MTDPQIDYLQGEITRLENQISENERSLNVLKHGIKIDRDALKIYVKGLEDMKARKEKESESDGKS